MREVSLSRLYLLRAMYLLVVVGLGVFAVPSILRHAGRRELMQGIVDAMLLAFWLLCMLGLRYPLRMLPVLLWELVWKMLWLGMVAWPAWRAGTMDAARRRTPSPAPSSADPAVRAALALSVRHYLRAPGDPWRAQDAASAEAPERKVAEA
jgi:hypothetical protein